MAAPVPLLSLVRTNASALLAVAAALAFLALAWPSAGARGVCAEEVQPYLPRHPHVIDDGPGAPRLLPPYEPDAPPRPRWVATPQWPVLAWDGADRTWPVFIRGHQSALGSMPGLALGRFLGGGVEGLQRSSVLLSWSLVALAFLLARRTSAGLAGPDTAWLAAAVTTLSFGTLFFARTGYGFEAASRVAMAGALVLAAPLRPASTGRAVAIGLVVGLAILCRATIAVTLAPALAILLAHGARRPTLLRASALAATAAALPVAVVLAIDLVAPFAQSTGPLANFPWHLLADRLALAPGHLLVQLAWLGDAGAVLRPLRNGVALDPSALFAAAAVGALPVGAAAVRWWRGTAGDGERMLVASLLGNVVVGALLYDSPAQFQLAMALDVLLAVALAEQVRALALRPRALVAVACAVLLLRGASTAVGLAQDARVANPMFSGKTQHAAVDTLRALGATGPEVLTTTYNQAGVLEAWTQGALAPLHGWYALRTAGPGAEAQAHERLRQLLTAFRPRYVLLSSGPNPMDGDFTDTRAIEAGLRSALVELHGELVQQWDFPTEAGGPGWRLVELRLP